MFISSVQTFSGVGKKNRELFAESEVLRIPHNANKKAHGSTASVSAFVSIVAGNHLVFGLLEMQKRFYIIYLSSIQLFRYIVFLVVISFAKIHHILQMTNFFSKHLLRADSLLFLRNFPKITAKPVLMRAAEVSE